ncbi:hypothetical protein H0H93_010756 [Arthromyces matolae]|nr:hypothetical protein H0H93_010756 [Arthromyces matolae]
MNLPDPEVLADPVVIPEVTCAITSCGGEMGGLRVCTGSKKRERRGTLCQTCKTCFYTVYYGQAYVFEDAKLLLLRILDPTNAIHQQPYKLRASAPTIAPPATQTGRVDCANPECFTKAGQRTQGSRSCAEHFCKTCCAAAAALAREEGRGRARCYTHSQAAVSEDQQARQTTTPPRPRTQGIHQHPTPTPPTPTPTPHTPTPTTAATQRLPSRLEARSTPPMRSNASAIQPSNQQQRQTLVPPRPLAQPLHPEWAGARSRALQENANSQASKVQKEAMEIQQKRTCSLVIWYQNSKPPLVLKHHVESFPHLQLSSCSKLLKNLNLTEDSYVDVFRGHEWETVDLETVINVAKGERVLLKLRPSLLEELKDCPTLLDEIERQSKHGSRKRSGPTLVSPLAKVPITLVAAIPPLLIFLVATILPLLIFLVIAIPPLGLPPFNVLIMHVNQRNTTELILARVHHHSQPIATRRQQKTGHLASIHAI